MPSKFVDIGAADNRQDVNMGLAHAFQRQVQGMIRVDMGKFQRFKEI